MCTAVDGNTDALESIQKRGTDWLFSAAAAARNGYGGY